METSYLDYIFWCSKGALALDKRSIMHPSLTWIACPALMCSIVVLYVISILISGGTCRIGSGFDCQNEYVDVP